jgi:hypothetical protein
VTITLPSYQTFSVRLKVITTKNSTPAYSNKLVINTTSGKIDPPLNVNVISQNTPRSLEDWTVLLTWDNSINIGSAPVSKLKIIYTYNERTPDKNTGTYTNTIYYSKIVDIDEWDSTNSYTWTLTSPLTKGQSLCNFSLFFVNENGEESVAADAPHNLAAGRSNTLFSIAATWKPDVTMPATPLFNSLSWTNNSTVDEFIKTYLTVGAERWSEYMGVDPKISSKIKSIDPKFYNGIYLNKYTSINDSSKPIIQCTPARYVAIKLNDGRWNFITVSFNLVFNKYYENNSGRASNWDLIYSTTHHLGHALGIGVYWHLNQLYDNFPGLKSKSIEYPRYRLAGDLFPQTKRIHNAIHTAAAEDFYEWRLYNILIPEPVLERASRPPVQNISAIPCNELRRLNLPCANTIPTPKITATNFYSYGNIYTKYELSNVYEPPLSQRVYANNRRFIPLDQMGSLTTDDIAWGDLNDSSVAALSSNIENENFPGCHFGLVNNSLNKRLFTYNHRTLKDIMLYRTINSDAENIVGSEPQRISYLSIAHLKDLGYTELYENQKQGGPVNLRAETIDAWAQGYQTSKLNNHNCCRGFSPTQIESWQSNPQEYSILSNGDSMLKIADIIDDTIYCYINPENGC